MSWVVDTCIIIDVLDNDPDFGLSSARMLDAHAADGLLICPITFAELAPAFLGDIERQKSFLRQINVDCLEGWCWADTEHAFMAWYRYVDAKRSGNLAKRPIADIQIGAFSERFQGLITRDPRHFSSIFPKLRIIPASGIR